MSEWKFSLFDHVEKHTGDYRAFGKIVARFTMSSGAERYVVEHKAEGARLSLASINQVAYRQSKALQDGAKADLQAFVAAFTR